MNTAIVITLIIVGGVVLISLVAIAWLWSMTSRGLGSLPLRGSREPDRRLDALEQEVRQLREDVDRLGGVIH